MGPNVRGLAAALIVLAAIASSHAYVVHTGEVYQVPEADRVSDKQLFARDADIVSLGLPYLNLLVAVPCRVYIRHMENETAVAAGLFGKMRTSGDTREAIDYVGFTEPGESPSRDAEDVLYINSFFEVHPLGNTTTSLLLEIELFHKNALREVTTYGSGDIVVLEDVLSAVPGGKNSSEETHLTANILWSSMMPGNLFVSDPKARFTATSLTVNAEGFSTIQLDVASMNSTKDPFVVKVHPTTNVTIFASEWVSPINLFIDKVKGVQSSRNPLCVATKDDVRLRLLSGSPFKDGTDAVIAGGSPCVKRPLPPREPALLQGRTNETSDDFKEVAVPTFPPPATEAPRTVAPKATSGSTIAARSGLTVLLVLLSFAW